MFDGWFKPRFYNKCKSLIKLTRVRLETVKKRKNAVIKYLKNDIAELLRNNLDYNAYGRTEGLLDERNRLSCYDFVERFYGCLASNVSLIQKSRECPEDCREAISSLIYAAARISEVPELRDLRSLFTERYKSSLEQFVNQEFVEKLNAQPSSKETKLQLLHELAREFAIEWDSKALEQKLFKQEGTELSENNQQSTDDVVDEGYKSNEHTSYAIESKNDLEGKVADDIAKVTGNGIKFHSPKGSIDDKNKLYSSSEDESTRTKESPEWDSLQASSSSIGSISEEEAESKKPFHNRFVPAPYNKPRVEQGESIPEEKTTANAADVSKENRPNQDNVSTREAKLRPKSVRRRFAKTLPDVGETKEEAIGTNYGFAATDDKIDENSIYPLKLPPARQAISRKHMKCDSMDQSDFMNSISIAEGTRRHIRTGSWHPEALSNYSHHPKLPDYDEVAARVQALGRR